MPLNVAHFPCGYGSRLSVSLLWSLGRWQTLVKCPNPCAGDTVGPLAIPHGHSSALGLEPSLQGLVRIGMCLLAYLLGLGRNGPQHQVRTNVRYVNPFVRGLRPPRWLRFSSTVDGQRPITRFVGKQDPVASDFEAISSP